MRAIPGLLRIALCHGNNPPKAEGRAISPAYGYWGGPPLRDAIDVAERTGLGIVADFGNMWMERDFRETLARAMPHVALMQIGDMVIGATGRPAPGGRAHVGKGELPLHRMMQDVIDAGYAGVYDLEVVAANFAQGYDAEELREGIFAASGLLDAMGLK